MQLCYCKLPLHTKTQFPNSEHEPDQPGDVLHFFFLHGSFAYSSQILIILFKFVYVGP